MLKVDAEEEEAYQGLLGLTSGNQAVFSTRIVSSISLSILSSRSPVQQPSTMAITRRERCELDRANSHHLRSEGRLQKLPATSLSVRGPGPTRKTYQPDPQAVAHPDAIAGEAVPELSEG